MDTIFALATAQGRAGISVVRISGPRAFEVAVEISGPLALSRQAQLRLLKDQSGDVIDQALVIVFEGPGSFTGEDVVELHLHGSIAVVRAVLSLLAEFDDVRLAEPGQLPWSRPC